MVRNNKGFGSVTLYIMLALAVLLVVSGSFNYAQRQAVLRYKAENVRLSTDNDMITTNALNQHKADAAALKRCEKTKNELLIKLGQCQEPTIITGCPTITIKQWEVTL